MCDGIKDMSLLRKQYQKSLDEDIEIIEIEFISGKLKYRDRWSVKNILDKWEIAQLDQKRAEAALKFKKGNSDGHS